VCSVATRSLVFRRRTLGLWRFDLAEMKASKWETIGGIPLTPAVQKFWRPVLSKALRLPFAARVPLNQTTFYVTTRSYRLNRVWGTMYLFFNPRQQLDPQGTSPDE